MLGDLLRLIPSGGGGQWQVAYQMAASAATGDEPDPNPDPRERIRLEELASIAELHVADVTGMQLTPSGRPVRIVPASRAEWARRTLDSWRPVLDRLSGEGAAQAPEEGGAAPASGGTGGEAGDLADDESAEEGRLAEMLARWTEAMAPMMVALQVGSAAGHLAHRALGQYELPLAPASNDEVLVVSANVSSTAEDWSLARDDLLLWLAVHELAHHAVLSRPHVAARLSELVVAHAREVRPDPAALRELFEGGDLGDMASIMDVLRDPSGLLAAGESGDAQRIRAMLDALTAAISGYAEHVTAAVADRLIGRQARIGEAMRRRRLSRGDGERMAEQLFGLRLDQDQLDRGEAFVRGVLDRGGQEELARLWVAEASLPTPAEVDAPGLWIERVNLPDVDATPGAGAPPDPPEGRGPTRE